MNDIWQTYGTELVVSLLSLLAVGISLFRAQAQETEAAANAVNELAESSQDLRERINQLETKNQRKDTEIEALRQRASQIPVLEAQVKLLSDELGRLQREASEMRERFECAMRDKQKEIDALKRREGITHD